MRIAYLNVISENIVESYFQRRNTRCFAFTLLNSSQYIFSIRREIAQVIQLNVDSRGNYTTFLNLVRGIRKNLSFYLLAYCHTKIQLITQLPQSWITRCLHGLLQLFDRIECIFELHHFTWRDTPNRNSGYHALQITNQS